MNEIAIILIIVIIIIILCIIILTLRHKRLNKPQSKNFAELVENLPPYGVDQNVQEAKEAFAYIENPTPLEHYRMAMIYLHNFEQKENQHILFQVLDPLRLRL
jgi:predicted Holliday junction resolvase-like endonuclease